ncbi:hypothetical protein BKA56DRAFT_589425 [Ilyonectria sp. MPI-CAGE-AT-0026]|nr:hypothetical protein BKA56DRAFT_589425 [Ilyonectria sp. MPI-CAGE-AT-0026]
MPSSNVVVIIGCGGMGLPLARRLGAGRQLFLADFSNDNLTAAREVLLDEGYSVETRTIDVSDYGSVSEFAQAASSAGYIETIVHTAGVSPTGQSSRTIYSINLVGTANVIDALLPVAQAGTSLICVSSMAGHLCPPIQPELERHMATAPRDQLLSHQDLGVDDSGPSGAPKAYAYSKRGNLLRVQAAAAAWGRRGARVNSVSPGVISTEHGRREIAGPAAKYVASSPAARVGTPQDIVNAVAFLADRQSSFITGTDILVDGGVTSSIKWKGGEDSKE